MKHSRAAAMAVLIVAGAGLTAATPAPRPVALLPLSVAQTDRIKETGCIFMFETPRRQTLFYAVETVMMVRTKAGISQCRVPEPTAMAFRDAKGPLICGGQRMSLKQTGKLIEPAEGSEGDGSTYPAILTVGTGPGAATVRGEASTAC